MAEKRKSSEKNNVGKKLVLGLIAVISLPILSNCQKTESCNWQYG